MLRQSGPLHGIIHSVDFVKQKYLVLLIIMQACFQEACTSLSHDQLEKAAALFSAMNSRKAGSTGCLLNWWENRWLQDP